MSSGNRCGRCGRDRWPSTTPGAPLCWGGAQCDAGRLALLERALRAVLPFLPTEHPVVGLVTAAPPPPPAALRTAEAAVEAARRRLLVEFPDAAEADRVRSALARHGYDPAVPSSLARALVACVAPDGA